MDSARIHPTFNPYKKTYEMSIIALSYTQGKKELEKGAHCPRM